MIKKVKKTKNGYLINDNIEVPNDKENRYYIEITKWLKTNKLSLEFSKEEIKQKKLNILKEKLNKKNILNIKYLNTEFQADLETRKIINNFLSAGVVPKKFYFQDFNNKEIPMTFKQLQGLSVELSKRDHLNFILFQKEKRLL